MFFFLSRIFPLFMLICSQFFDGCTPLESTHNSEDHLKVYFIDVGQGDACLLETPTHHFYLYDVGNHEALLVPFLKKLGVDTLEAVFISHPDLDHYGALESLLHKIPIKGVYLPLENRNDSTWLSLKSAVIKNSRLQRALYAGDTLILKGAVHVRALWPFSVADFEGNNLSLVLRVEYATHTVMLTGDIENEAEMGILDSKTLLASDILKVAHHGSRTSNGLPFLSSVNPSWAVISCDSTVYGHPHAEALADLKWVMSDSTHILRTDKIGSVGFEISPTGVRRFNL